jgi:hypothetical protein
MAVMLRIVHALRSRVYRLAGRDTSCHPRTPRAGTAVLEACNMLLLRRGTELILVVTSLVPAARDGDHAVGGGGSPFAGTTVHVTVIGPRPPVNP